MGSVMWAFSDESERADTMYFGVLLVPASRVPPARRALRGLLLPGQRRVHTAKESPRRRRELLDVVAALDVQAVVLHVRRPLGLHRVTARQMLVERACEEVSRSSVVSWQLDDQEPVQAARDRHDIDGHLHRTGESFVYDHRPSASEPLLWAIDAVLWAVGTGGEWRRRVSGIVDVRRIEP